MIGKKTFSLGITLALAASAPLAHAGDDIDSRETNAIAEQSLATTTSEYDGRYHHARALAVEGSQSVLGRTKTWMSNMQTWIDGWVGILAFSDLKNDISFDAFESQLTTKLGAQATLLVQLQTEAAAIKQFGSDVLTEVSALKPVAVGPESQTYAGIVSTLMAQEQQLVAMIPEVSGTPSSKLSTLVAVDKVSRDGITAHMKAALLARARYPLQSAMNEVSSLLIAEKILDPLLARITDGYGKMNKYLLASAPFHADAAITGARKDCADFTAALTTAGGPAGYMATSKSQGTNMCSGIESLYASVKASSAGVRAKQVNLYMRGEKTKLAGVCTAANPSPACERLALLAALTRDNILAMDDAHLQFVEMGWSTAMDRALATKGP